MQRCSVPHLPSLSSVAFFSILTKPIDLQYMQLCEAQAILTRGLLHCMHSNKEHAVPNKFRARSGGRSYLLALSLQAEHALNSTLSGTRTRSQQLSLEYL